MSVKNEMEMERDWRRTVKVSNSTSSQLWDLPCVSCSTRGGEQNRRSMKRRRRWRNRVVGNGIHLGLMRIWKVFFDKQRIPTWKWIFETIQSIFISFSFFVYVRSFVQNAASTKKRNNEHILIFYCAPFPICASYLLPLSRCPWCWGV